MKIYLIKIKTYDVVEDREHEFLVKAFQNKNDANNYKDHMTSRISKRVKNLEDRDQKCCTCFGEHDDGPTTDECKRCEMNRGEYSDYITIILADGYELRVDCDPQCGDDPEFCIEEIELV